MCQIKLCVVPKCKKPAAKNRKKCYCCIRREFTLRNPLKSAYYDLRSNVAKRNRIKIKNGQPIIGWNLTLEDFKKFCYET